MNSAYRCAHREMWAYLKHFPDATAEEIAALRQWVKGGNSPYENGNGVYDDSYHTMDFISALRFWDDMYQEWLEDPKASLNADCPFKMRTRPTLRNPRMTACPSNRGLCPQTPGV